MKKRLDVLLVEQGLADSREKAKAIIMSGIVYVENEKEDKAGSTFEETSRIEVRGKTLPYVSRGGLKLEKAMKSFPITLEGSICMDVGHGQLDWKLRNDPRVVCMEKTNIRYVTKEQIDGAELDFASIDVSFISLTKVLPPVYDMLRDKGEVVALIKPQFEAGREKVGKKGVVRDKSVHEEVIVKILDYAPTIGFRVLGLTYSPVKGPEGNIEYLVWLRKSGLAASEDGNEASAKRVVEESHAALDH